MDTYANTPAGGMMDEDQDTADIREYLHVIDRHKWGILAFVLAVTLLSIPVIYSQTPIYRGDTTLLIESDTANLVSIEQVYDLPGSSKQYYQTQIEVLKSRTLAELVVKKLNLAQREDFILEDKGWLGFGWKDLLPAAWFEENESQSPLDINSKIKQSAGYLRKNLEVVPVQNSQMVHIRFSSHIPQIAADISNALATVYIENDLESRLQMTQKASEWLTERLASLKKALQASEQRLQAYMEKENLVNVSGVKSLSTDRLNVINSGLVEASRKRAQAQAIYQQVSQAQQQGVDKVYSLPVVLNHPLLQDYRRDYTDAQKQLSELAKRYGPKHPRLIQAKSNLNLAKASLERQLANVVDSVRKEYEAALADEKSLKRDLASARKEVSGVGKKQYQLDVLQREVDANRNLYDMFLTRFKETSEVSGIESANARIVDLSLVPGKPYKPNKKAALTIVVLLSFGFAVGAAFLYERLDNTIKSSAEAALRLGIPALGALPKLQTDGKKDRTPLRAFIDNDQSVFAEVVRTIRTGVLLSGLDEPHKVIVVTSSIPGEGKSTVAMNLAYAMSHMANVLLIDADMRRPSIADVCDLGANAKGLSQFTAGTAKISETVHKLPDSRLSVMPAGVLPPNPLELLSSARFQDVLQTLAKAFDHIVIDSAPTMAVSDSQVLSRYASGVVYVVQADSTPCPLAKTGIDRLKQVDATLIGVVLNKVTVNKKGKYSYEGDYYTNYSYTQS